MGIGTALTQPRGFALGVARSAARRGAGTVVLWYRVPPPVPPGLVSSAASAPWQIDLTPLNLCRNESVPSPRGRAPCSGLQRLDLVGAQASMSVRAWLVHHATTVPQYPRRVALLRSLCCAQEPAPAPACPRPSARRARASFLRWQLATLKIYVHFATASSRYPVQQPCLAR